MGACTQASLKPQDIVYKKAKKIMAYDFDMGKNPQLTFAMRFARENTGDKGKRLDFESADKVIEQFKIYVIGVYEILVKTNQLDNKSDSPYIVAPFMPPQIIMRVWELLMTYTHGYMAFCEKVFGKGKILVHNNEPVMEEIFRHYKAFQEKIEAGNKPYEHGLDMFFPKYTIEQYQREINDQFIAWMSEADVKRAQKYFEKQIKKQKHTLRGNKAIQLAEMLVPEYLQSLKRGHQVVQKKDIEIVVNKGQYISEKINYLNDMQMPNGFKNKLCQKLGITEALADRYITEYKKFVYLITQGKGQMLTPSEQTDQVWHLHMSYWDHYHYHMNQLFKTKKQPNRILHHNPTEGGDSQQLKWDDCYKMTLEFYKSVFEQEPPSDIWETPEQRFQAELVYQLNVDVFRFCCYEYEMSKSKVGKWTDNETIATDEEMGIEAIETCLCESMEELIYSPNPWNEELYKVEKLMKYINDKELEKLAAQIKAIENSYKYSSQKYSRYTSSNYGAGCAGAGCGGGGC